MSLAFPWLPPEINSSLMFAGAGSGPLFTAAAAWEGLAADLSGAASSFQSVVTGLTGGAWTGPASLSMAAAAAPYVAWLNAAAAQAEAASAQAVASATAFEAAQSLTVHPAAVTANRAQLMALVATNFLGQNTPAIFATEFEYVEMWAQDVAAMFGYHGAATSAAAMLPTFSLPPVSLAGLAGLLPAPLAGLASSAGAALAAPMQTATTAVSSVAAMASTLPLSSVQQVAQMAMYPASMSMSPIMMAVQAAMRTTTPAAAAANMAAAGAPKLVGDVVPKGLGGGAGGLGGLGAASAGLGKARLVGAMSVPPTWQGSSPARMASAAMAGMGAEVPAAAAGGMGGPMPMPMPMGGMGAGMAGGMLGRGGASPNAPQARPSVIPRTGVG